MQAGFFTTTEAVSCGVTGPTLGYQVRTGAVERVLRGVYRFAVATPTEQDEFIALWLWAGRKGVFSHVTALWLHELSDAMPSRIHITVPQSTRYARTSTPSHVTLHVAPLPDDQTGWIQYVPVTTPTRTIQDCLAGRTSPDLVEQAIREAAHRKLISPADARRFRRALLHREQP